MRKIQTVFLSALFAICFIAISSFKMKEVQVVNDAKSSTGNIVVSGGGTAEENGEKSTFTFSAVKSMNGKVSGYLVYSLRSADQTVWMQIDCMRVDGNRATLSGVITKTLGVDPNSGFVGSRASFSVQDNGEGTSANPDYFSDVTFGEGSCNSEEYFTYIPMQGNIQIKR